jgi:hypothetical protein
MVNLSQSGYGVVVDFSYGDVTFRLSLLALKQNFLELVDRLRSFSWERGVIA